MEYIIAFGLGMFVVSVYVTYKMLGGRAWYQEVCIHRKQILEETWQDGTQKICCSECGKVWFKRIS